MHLGQTLLPASHLSARLHQNHPYRARRSSWMPIAACEHPSLKTTAPRTRARLAPSSRPDIPCVNDRRSVELVRIGNRHHSAASRMASRRSSDTTSRGATGDEEDFVSADSEEQSAVNCGMPWPLLVRCTATTTTTTTTTNSNTIKMGTSGLDAAFQGPLCSDVNQQGDAKVAFCSVGILICYADRSNIATAILPMSKEFDWDKSFQGFVLSAFFGGYMLTQVLGGRLADQYGGKNVLAFGVSVWSVCTIATPWAASWGTASLIACRIALGVGEGVAFPAVHSLIATGVPRKYQSTSVAAVTAASYLGTAAAFGLSPIIIQDAGWEWSFYLFGGLAVLWLPAWLPFEPPRQRLPVSSASIPDTDEYLSAEEETGSADEVEEQEQFLPTAVAATGIKVDAAKFLKLLRQREVLAICIAQYTQSWGLYGLINWLPTFFSEYYHVEIGQLGGLTMLPYVVQGGMGAVSGVVADALISRGVGVRTVRVSLQVLGMLGPAACLVIATSPLTAGNAEAGSLIITIGLGLSALTLGGVSVSHLDIAPRNAGLVFGAGNTLATLAGLLAVPLNGLLLDATDSWALVFGLTAAHYVAGSIMWAAWAGEEPLKEDTL